MQPGDDHKVFQWPEMQRFDFLVRTRVLNEEELAEYRVRERANAGQPSEHRRALQRALLTLMSQDIGTTVPDGRAVPTHRDRSWRSPCLK